MALCGGIVLEEALDLSFDRLLMMMMIYICICIYMCVCVYIYIDCKSMHCVNNSMFITVSTNLVTCSYPEPY